MFRFCATYTDPSGQPPLQRRLELNLGRGDWCSPTDLCADFPRDPIDGVITTGATWCADRRLQTGLYYHRCHFQAANGTHIYWSDIFGDPGPTVSEPNPLVVTLSASRRTDCPPPKVACEEATFHPGDVPSLVVEVKDENGGLLDANLVRVFTSPPGGQNTSIAPERVSLGRYEWNTCNVPASAWVFGCDEYVFTVLADRQLYASGQDSCVLETCDIPDFEPVRIESVASSGSVIVPANGLVEIRHTLTLDALETVWVEDGSRNVKRRLLDREERTPGEYVDTWDGLTDNQQPAPSGPYTMRVEALHLDSDHAQTRFGITGSGEGQIRRPRGLAYDGEHVHILDNTDQSPAYNKLMIFNTELQFVAQCSIGTNDASAYVYGLALDPLNALLYVIDEQPAWRITAWDASLAGADCNYRCDAGVGDMRYPQAGWPWLGAIGFDAAAQRVLVWADSPSRNDSRLFAYPPACAPKTCEMDPTPSADSTIYSAGVVVDGDGHVWTATGGNVYVSDLCGGLLHPPFPSYSALNRIAIRYGRLVYWAPAFGGYVLVTDLRANSLQSLGYLEPSGDFGEGVLLATSNGPYTFAGGKCLGCAGEFQMMRIRDHNSAAIHDGRVSVVRAAFAMIEPNGGDHWVAGTQRKIRWSTVGSSSVVNIRLLRDLEEVPNALQNGTNLVNTGEYFWDIPELLPFAANYRIRVEDADDPTLDDLADAPVTILTRVGDGDGDADIDLADAIMFMGDGEGNASCILGPNRPVAIGICQGFDSELDGNVDLADFAQWQNAFTGP